MNLVQVLQAFDEPLSLVVMDAVTVQVTVPSLARILSWTWNIIPFWMCS